jgi:hypothetical protein
METIITVNIFVFLIMSAVCVFIGLDPKKWSSWLLGLYGFLTGFSFSFIRSDADMGSRLILGALCAYAVMAAGIMIYHTKQVYTKEYVQSVRDNFNKLHAAAEKRRERKSRKK